MRKDVKIRFTKSEVDTVGLLSDPDIVAIPDLIYSDTGKEKVFFSGFLLDSEIDTINNKIDFYIEAKLNDVSNDDPKAKKFRAKKESESFIDLVRDVPTKEAFRKLKEYIDLILGE